MSLLRALALASLAAPLPLTAQTATPRPAPGATVSPSPRAAVHRGLCGEGILQFRLGGSSIGQETFKIVCEADGSYAAGGRTELALPSGTIDVASSVTLDSALRPTVVTAQGKIGEAQIDQKIVFRDTVATVTDGGATRTVRHTPGAAWIGNNVYYSLALLLARYDSARGGVQSVPTFPNLPVSIEYKGEADVQASDTSAAIRRAFSRYEMKVGPQRVSAWLDGDGRLAVIAVPAQEFTVVRRGYESYAAALAKQIARPAPGGAGGPAYSAPPGAPYTAEDAVIAVGRYALAGTLLVPKQGEARHPAVVLITGSGQQTRDEELPIPGLEGYRPFRQIAEALAAAGIAVLRVDDRGAGASSGGETVLGATTRELAGDTRAQVAWLRSRPDIDPTRIALVGHSEGATIASMVAATDPRIAAVVMLAGTGMRGDSVLVGQLDDILARDSTLSRDRKAELRARQRETFQTILSGGQVPGESRTIWLREFLTADPLDAIRRVRQPMLVLQGERDRQVMADNAARIGEAAQRAGNPDVTVRVLPGLNHLFLPAETGAVSEYSSLRRAEIGEDVIGVMRDWLTAKLKPRMDGRK